MLTSFEVNKNVPLAQAGNIVFISLWPCKNWENKKVIVNSWSQNSTLNETEKPHTKQQLISISTLQKSSQIDLCIKVKHFFDIWSSF